jgi:hypothetical protein
VRLRQIAAPGVRRRVLGRREDDHVVLVVRLLELLHVELLGLLLRRPLMSSAPAPRHTPPATGQVATILRMALVTSLVVYGTVGFVVGVAILLLLHPPRGV